MQLETMAAAFSKDNWDGYGARAVNAEALEAAKKFDRQLKEGWPRPSYGLTWCGDIEAVWDAVNGYYVMSITIDRHSVLRYVTLLEDGDNRVGLVEIKDEIPQELVNCMEEFFKMLEMKKIGIHGR